MANDDDMKEQANGTSAVVVGWKTNPDYQNLPNLTQTHMGIWFQPRYPQVYTAYPMDKFSVRKFSEKLLVMARRQTPLRAHI